MFSPSSVDEDAIGKGYLEVYPIQKEYIFGEKSRHNSSIKFNRAFSKFLPSASGESFGIVNSDYRRLNSTGHHLDSVFFDDDADTCSVITMHPYNQINTNVPTYQHLTTSTNLPLSIKNQQTVDFDLTKQQQLTSTIKFGKNSFSYIDANDDGECNKLVNNKLIIFINF